MEWEAQARVNRGPGRCGAVRTTIRGLADGQWVRVAEKGRNGWSWCGLLFSRNAAGAMGRRSDTGVGQGKTRLHRWSLVPIFCYSSSCSCKAVYSVDGSTKRAVKTKKRAGLEMETKEPRAPVKGHDGVGALCLSGFRMRRRLWDGFDALQGFQVTWGKR